VAGSHSEIRAGTIDFVGVAVTAGPGNGERAAGCQRVQARAGAILNDVNALGLCDRNKVVFHASKTDTLFGQSAMVRGHAVQIVVTNAQSDSRGSEEACKRAHDVLILRLQQPGRKDLTRDGALGRNTFGMKHAAVKPGQRRPLRWAPFF
jgi:hypothetical protein